MQSKKNTLFLMEISLINALIYSIVPTFLGTLFTLYITEKVKGKVKNSFDTKLENQKKEHNLELSQFQAEINFLKSKENYKFTKLHEKRFEIMEVTYKLINAVLIVLHKYVSPLKMLEPGKTFLENDNVLQEEFSKKHSEFTIYYNNNRYYFDSSTKTIIDSYLNEVREIYNMYSEKHMYGQMDEKPDREIMIRATQAFKNIELKIYPVKENIEKRFAEILEN